jgi:hypothetical protein
MTFKSIALVAVLVSAVAMGACGKKDPLSSSAPKDSKLIGSCTYKDENGLSLCEQGYLPNTISGDALDKAADGLKNGCNNVRDAKYSSSGCSTSDAIGGCKGTEDNGVTSMTVVYKGTLTVEQVKAGCAQRGLEFFQP